MGVPESDGFGGGDCCGGDSDGVLGGELDATGGGGDGGEGEAGDGDELGAGDTAAIFGKNPSLSVKIAKNPS